MPTYSFTHQCGHRGSEYLTGSRKSRSAYYIQRGENQDCPECAAKNREIANKLASEEAAAIAEKSGLPLLIGSEKQIAWAETIRLDFITRKADEIRKIANEKYSHGCVRSREDSIIDWTPEQKSLIETSIENKIITISAEQSARWWIDNRGMSAFDIVVEIGRGNHAGLLKIASQEQIDAIGPGRVMRG